MKIKLLLITLSIALPINAEWELFDKYKHTTAYLDKELIRQDGKAQNGMIFSINSRYYYNLLI